MWLESSKMVDKGSGPTVLMIPGLQGRWEWMSPAVDALATHYRVTSDSLAGNRGKLRELELAKVVSNFVANHYQDDQLLLRALA